MASVKLISTLKAMPDLLGFGVSLDEDIIRENSLPL